MAGRSTAAMPKAMAIAQHWLDKAKTGGMEAEVVLEFGDTVDQVTCCWRCGGKPVERAHIVAASQGGADHVESPMPRDNWPEAVRNHYAAVVELSRKAVR
jgi:hypothetical protein